MLKPERKALLDSLVAAGLTLKDLQRKHGFNYKTVRKYYPDYRAGRTNSTPVLEALEENREVVEQLAKEKAPGSVIAATVGVSPGTLKKHRPELMWTKREAGSFGGMVSQLGRLRGVN